MKIANIDRESLHIVWTTWAISMKYSGKICLITLLQATKKTKFHPFFKRYIFQKNTGVAIKMTPSLFKIKEDIEYNPGLIKFTSTKFLKHFFDFFLKMLNVETEHGKIILNLKIKKIY